MSGPVQREDELHSTPAPVGTSGAGLEITESRATEVGGLPIHRALPRHGRRMVGAWCFLDRMGPASQTPNSAMKVGPHPHIGLHTVTWLVQGEVLHTDSLGSNQLIKAGQLNLMSAGHGIAHAEVSQLANVSDIDGLQLWIAQPESTRHGPSSFAHIAALPQVELPAGHGTVLIGEFGGEASPAIVDSPLVGVELVSDGPLNVDLRSQFEYAVFVFSGNVSVDGQDVHPNEMAYLGIERNHIRIDCGPNTRIFLFGGEPFEYEVLMWWNFVARERDELDRAYSDWKSGDSRFGPVDSGLGLIEAPKPFWH
jgi:redox-sensitive bicupin YhaK (pirin superfamily)